MLKTLFSSCINSPKNYSFDGEDKDEQILYVYRKAFITNLDWITIAALMFTLPGFLQNLIYFLSPTEAGFVSVEFKFVLTMFWYTFTFGFIFVSFLNWFFNVLIISTKRIFDLDVSGILYKNISETTLDNVEDVTSNVRGALGVTFNIGSVFIQTAAEKREFEFSGLGNPSRVRDIISDLVASYNRSNGHNRNNN